MPEPTAAADPIDSAMLADRAELRRLRRSIARARRSKKPFDRNQRRFDRILEASTRLREQRRESVPEIGFDLELPVLDKRDEITAAIREHPVVVVCGETGSGKSTQLPKLCLAAGRGVDGLIGHTQPRRLAARAVATRIADELGAPLGELVGYKVRFRDETAPGTLVKLMTDGVLLAEAQGDPSLSRYDTIIVDEAHERSLNIDFLLGLLRRLIDRRPELRVVITSATIDAERFAEHFARGETPAPVIEVSGRTFPVEVRYDPPDEGQDPSKAVVRAVADLYRERVGDTLVFLPTERDIREAARLVRGELGDAVDVIPLYARLSAAEQQRVFKKGKKHRVVLATNVAESSLTVPGIMAVVDTGTARVARYSPRTRVQRLPIEPVSQASADQRAGRCGRVAPGVCVRLYKEDDYLARPRYAVPEIRRTNLAAVILRLLTLKLGELDQFPLLDRPKPEAIRSGYATLRELQAIDDAGGLTPLGERLGRMPVDPRVGRMILGAAEEGCLAEVLIIAAALEVQDPRERPADKQEQADAVHARYVDGRSDFLAYLKLWDHLQQLRSEVSRSQFRKQCSRQFLSHLRVMEWHDVYRQLVDLAKQEGLKPAPRQDAYGAIHRALLTGLLSAVAMRRGEEGYQASGGSGFRLWPGAGPAGTQPRWIVAAETVETSRRYLRTAARIRPEWLPRLAEHVVKKEYSGIEWSVDQQTVVAREKSLLFDLPIASKKSTPYGPIDPVVAREVFLRQALVEEQLSGDWSFLEANRTMRETLQRDAAKLRTAANFADDDALYAFYDERVPADAFDARTFRRWVRRAGRDNESLLLFDPDAGAKKREELDADAFPDAMEFAGHRLPLEYEHDRGSDRDGVTLHVPRDLLPLVDAARLEWGVPGNLHERVVATIRLLPKPIRTRLVPAPDVATRVVASLDFGEGLLLTALATALGREAAADVPVDAVRLAELPEHLRVNVVVEDDNGDAIAAGRDLAALQAELSESDAADSGAIHDPRFDRTGIVEWDFDDLPPSVTNTRGSFEVTAYPALVDRGESVDLMLLPAEDAARTATLGGVRRLLLIACEGDLRTQVKWLPDWDAKRKELRRVEPDRDVTAEVMELLAARMVAGVDDPPRTRAAFDSLRKRAKSSVVAATHEATPVVMPLLEQLIAARKAATTVLNKLHHTSGEEVHAQLDRLMPPRFLVTTPWDRLSHYPRYLKAILLRLQRVTEGGGGQDRRMQEQVTPHEQRLADFLDGVIAAASADEVERYRWMVEEYRVSVFAQRLGTAEKVSPKRLEEQWRRCRGLDST